MSIGEGTWRAEAAALWRLGAPMALTQLVQFSVQAVDVLMIGRLGAEALAASSLGLVMFFMAWLALFGPAMAVSPLVAQAIGAAGAAAQAGRPAPDVAEDVRLSVRMSLWAIIAAFAPIYLFFSFGAEFAMLLGQSPEVAARAEPYLLAVGPSLPFVIGLIVLRNFLAALDRARVPLLIICAMTVLNAALNYLLIFGSFGFPRLELVGAGVASTISNAAAFAALGLYASRERAARAFEVFRDFATPHWRRLRAVLALGLPISITTAFEGMLFNGSVLLVGLIGATEVAAFQIALNVSSLAFMAPLGISFAGAVRVGLHAGAGDLDGVRRAAALTIVFAVVAISFVAAPVAAAPRAITALYLDASDAANRELMALAATFLPIAAGFMLTDAVQVAANQSLRGLKDVRAPMVITGVCYWIVGFPFAAWLSQATPAGAAGVWWGILVGISSAALALSWRLRSLVRPRAAPAAPQTA